MPNIPADNTTSLGIALSTMNGNLLRNKTLVQQIAELKTPVVVVNQFQHDGGRLSLESLGWSPEHSHLIQMDTLGLSLSRNAAIDALETPWAILADDDITLDVHAFQTLSRRLSHEEEWQNVGALATLLMKDVDTPWRQGSQDLSVIQGRSVSSLRRIQSINSMELVLHTRFLRHWGIQFDTRFGLGAPPTQGGEEVMLLNSILRCGGDIVPLDLAPRLHPEESSGQGVNAATAFTQGAVHRLVFGSMLWPALFLLYTLKRMRSGKLNLALDYAKGGRWASHQS